jgi:hypothetical protein
MKCKMIKKIILIFLLILIVNLQIASSAIIEMKSNFSRGETLTGKVSGNFFIPVQETNIFLYRKDGRIRVPMDFQVEKIGEDYYFYCQLLGKDPNNYSIIIKNVKYLKLLGEISEEDLREDFVIDESIADFSVEPGAVKTNGTFSLKFKNLQDKKISIHYWYSSEEEQNGNESESNGFFDLLFGGSAEEGSSPEKTEGTFSITNGATVEKEFNSLPSEKEQLNILTLSSLCFGCKQNP